MPGNLVSFKVTLDDPETLSLATAAGDPIASHIVTRAGERMFEPVEPLAAGNDLVLTYTECPGQTPGSGTVRQYAFTTDEPSAIELRPGELEVADGMVLYPDREDMAVAVLRLRYTSPDARGNAGHLVEHRATVDGQPTFVSNIDGTLTVDVHTVCRENISGFTPGMCGGLYSVPPGRHVVEVQSHFFGVATDPSPVQLTIETVCPGDVDSSPDEETSSSDQASDTSSSSSDAVATTAALDGVGEATTTDVQSAPTVSGPSASGCALRPGNAGGGAALLGLLFVLARRRRNRR